VTRQCDEPKSTLDESRLDCVCVLEFCSAANNLTWANPSMRLAYMIWATSQKVHVRYLAQSRSNYMRCASGFNEDLFTDLLFRIEACSSCNNYRNQIDSEDYIDDDKTQHVERQRLIESNPEFKIQSLQDPRILRRGVAGMESVWESLCRSHVRTGLS